MNRLAFVFAAALVITTLAAPPRASADVNYTHRYLDSGQALSSRPETRVLAKPGARLEETWQFFGDNYVRENRLFLFAEKKEIVMDTVLKMYKVVPFETPAEDAADGSTVACKDLGEETIHGFKTRHFQIDITWDYKNASPDADRVVRLELWVAPPTSLKAYPTDQLPDPWRYYASDDAETLEALKRARQGLAVRTRVSTPAKDTTRQYREVYTEEITSLNMKPLDDAYFKIPADCKQVTADEYRLAQQMLVEQRIE